MEDCLTVDEVAVYVCKKIREEKGHHITPVAVSLPHRTLGEGRGEKVRKTLLPRREDKRKYVDKYEL